MKMKRVLMTSTLALAASLGMSGLALAQNYNVGKSGAFAKSKQFGIAKEVRAEGNVSNNTISGDVGGTGLVNVQQNGGANSTVQDSNTLGAILNATSTPENIYRSGTLALSSQVAVVTRDSSKGAGNSSSSGSHSYTSSGSHTSSSSSTHTSSGSHSHAWNAGNDTTPEAANSASSWNRSGSKSRSNESTWNRNSTDTWNHSFTAVASSNSLGSVSGTGMINVSQNTGNNSVLQSSNTTAAIMNGQTLP